VRTKLGLAPFKPKKRGPSFSARRRAWRDKLMTTNAKHEFKIVGYLLSYHVNHQTFSTFVKTSWIARESGIPFAIVKKAFDWMEKSGFIKTGQRDDGAPYATLILGNAAPDYVFAGGSAKFARCLGKWLDEIFLSVALTAADRAVAYTVSRFIDPKSGSCNAGYPLLAKTAGVAEKTVQRAVENLRRAMFLDTNLQPGRHLILTPTPDLTLDIVPPQITDSTEKTVGPSSDSVDSISHEGGMYFSNVRSVAGVDRFRHGEIRPCAGWSNWLKNHVWIDRDSPEWHAWQRYHQSKGLGSVIATHPYDPSRVGWFFKAKFPPVAAGA